ncbi:phosphate/phosphite/phosphonate ABC transporter substrate-binding protein [Desulfonatronum sp. SC1]|uniref:phosphate/phosphite/phosphonate ABC transporter substrate-binding protein n=1 Tax=Desulfonatronum sp. SC1 TaxID=2109626 RepID=UPI000D30BCC6|nr:PhnD/SsuA/transferrin family substrate-binding protein [Desulfonatronum sp. SC1]PTN38437.1 hypothetical protein C6366_02450 [Desulfonatronum sp. SC1]
MTMHKYDQPSAILRGFGNRLNYLCHCDAQSKTADHATSLHHPSDKQRSEQAPLSTRNIGTSSCIQPLSQAKPAANLLYLLVTLLTLWTIPTTALAQAADSNFRIGFTNNMFTEVNENDARAAMTVWGQTVARERGIPVEPEVLVYKAVQDMLPDLLDGQMDVAAVTSMEYDLLRHEVEFSPIFLTYHDGETAEEFVLLAHRDGPLETLADLAGRHVHVHQALRASLAPLWLDALLVQEKLEPLAELAGRVTTLPSLSQTLLPVFFRQADACLVTRHGFETMVELNPQLGAQLHILAASEPMVPAVFAFRRDYAPSFLEQLLAGIRDLHETPAGGQVLLVFNSERIGDYPESALNTALELIALHRQIVMEDDQ